MLRLVFTLAALLAFAGAQAQITLSSAYFPAAGDTLKYAVADSNLVVDLLMAGAGREWNFGNVEPANTFNEVYRSAAGDPLFPRADVVSTVDSLTTAYYRISGERFDLVGLESGIDLLPGFTFAAPLSPARPERRAPLAFGASFDSQTENSITVDTDSLPAEAIESLGDFLTNVDSIRVTNRSVREDVVDAYGTLSLNGITYEVLRERRTEVLDTRVSVKSGPLDFIDITGTVLLLLPESEDILGEQPPTTTYYYWAADSKEAVAVVRTNQDGMPNGMTFKRTERTSSTAGPFFTRARVRVYPNPAAATATFEVRGLDRGSYRLRVVNLLGQEVRSSRFTATDGEVKLNVDVSALPYGPYLYSVSDERGRILTTKKMLVGR